MSRKTAGRDREREPTVICAVLRQRLYYLAKPILPWTLRLAIRRLHAFFVLRRAGHIWPIDPIAGEKPCRWPGWPEGKQFAFVLTHDVESRRGLDRVRDLAELEMELGFRSSFNFIPKGEYEVPPLLRTWLTERGFEVGVHDLHHDGKLFRSRVAFESKADEINSYLKRWKAVGFRSGYMLRNLEWIQHLDIAYDASTFDTDPFEPQPDGVRTIFPFWVTQGAQGFAGESFGFEPAKWEGTSVGSERPCGYAELPYTLPQDSTLFLILGETSNLTWKRKLSWIAAHGGMALLNAHPDYMRFDSGDCSQSFPLAYYRDFLQHAKSTYRDQYWSALPRDVAQFVMHSLQTSDHQEPTQSHPLLRSEAQVREKIWIDLDNTPHVPFFRPIIKELGDLGYQVVLTARDAFQVCELAKQSGLTFTKIGRHHGKNRVLKVLGLLYRSLQLLPFVLRERPIIALSHGSRAQILLCNLLRIPTIMINDYEHAKTPPLVRPRWEIVPDVLLRETLHCTNRDRICTYGGIKEDVYTHELKPDPSILRELDLVSDSIVVAVRPPATEAHYHNPESEQLFVAFMNRLCETSSAQAVLLPRNRKQEVEIRTQWPQWFIGSKVIIPKVAVNGLNLLWHADFVVSGGGTMNREAAALGVPVYSIFRGTLGAVDRQLQAEGRLTLITSVEEVQNRVVFTRRDKTARPDAQARPALTDIIEHLERIIRSECSQTISPVLAEY